MAPGAGPSSAAESNTAGTATGLWRQLAAGWQAFSPDPMRMAAEVHVSVAPLFLFASVGIVLLVAGLGLGSTGVWFGALINPQNRMSLSLVQIFSWTALIIPAYAVMAAINTGLSPSQGIPVFPEVPGWAWAVLGITITSPLASSLINAAKPGNGQSRRQVPVAALRNLPVLLAPLENRLSPRNASVTDLFYGEDVDDQNRLDVTRTQNVLFTLVLLLVYGGSLMALMSSIQPSAIISSLSNGSVLFSSLPNPGGSFAGLLLLTHGAYIAGKFQQGQTEDLPGNGQAGTLRSTSSHVGTAVDTPAPGVANRSDDTGRRKHSRTEPSTGPEPVS